MQLETLGAVNNGWQLEGRRRSRVCVHTIESSKGDERRIYIMGRITKLTKLELSKRDNDIYFTVVHRHDGLVCLIRALEKPATNIWAPRLHVSHVPIVWPILWEEYIPFEKVHIVTTLQLSEIVNKWWKLTPFGKHEYVYQIRSPKRSKVKIVRSTTVNILEHRGLINMVSDGEAKVWRITDEGKQVLKEYQQPGRYSRGVGVDLPARRVELELVNN